MMSDRIVKSVVLRAPVERVWRAVSDHREFGTWFRVQLDQPFAVGAASTGRMTYPGYEHMPWSARVVAIEPPRRLAFEWPHMDDQQQVREDWAWTLVEFRLEPEGEGTRLTITESGFDALPAEARDNSFRLNEGGWTEQMGNIAAHVDG
jgi:uncharacterized protein YndB with AHSA1/START domain